MKLEQDTTVLQDNKEYKVNSDIFYEEEVRAYRIFNNSVW